MFELQKLKIEYLNIENKVIDLSADVTLFTGKDNLGKSTLIDLIYKLLGSTTEKTIKSSEHVIQNNIKKITLYLKKQNSLIRHIWKIQENKYYIKSESGVSFPSGNNEIFKQTINDGAKTLSFPAYDSNYKLTNYRITPYTISSFFRFNQTDSISSLISNKIGTKTSKALEEVAIGKISDHDNLKLKMEYWSINLSLEQIEQKIYKNEYYNAEIKKINNQKKKLITTHEKDESEKDVKIFSKEMAKIKTWQRKIILNELQLKDIKNTENIISCIKKLSTEIDNMDSKIEVKKALKEQLTFFEEKIELSFIKTVSIKSKNKKLENLIHDSLINIPINKRNKMEAIMHLETMEKLMKERAEASDELEEKRKDLLNRKKIISPKLSSKDVSVSFFGKINKAINTINKQLNLNLNQVTSDYGLRGSLSNGDTAKSLILSGLMSIIIYKNFASTLGEEFRPSLISWNRLIISGSKEKEMKDKYGIIYEKTISRFWENGKGPQIIAQDKLEMICSRKKSLESKNIKVNEIDLNKWNHRVLGDDKKS